jgi:membrane associated rhomboid family serine protease
MIPLKDERPTENFPYITISLIVANVAIFIYQLTAGRPFTEAFALKPYYVFNEPNTFNYFTFVSSMFLHGSIGHLLGNMLFLWIFGDNIEDTLGKFKYLIFYLLCGVAAGLIHAFFHMDSRIPTLGASGAISGILGAYIVLFPRTRILALIPIFYFIRLMYVPAKFFLGVWFIFQFLYLASPRSHGVAFLAHIGGFIVGFFLIQLFTRLKPAEIVYEDGWFDEDGGPWA